MWVRRLTELLNSEAIARLVQSTRDGGAEIIKYLKSGSAFYAPGAAIAEMVEAILQARNRVTLRCSSGRRIRHPRAVHGRAV